MALAFLEEGNNGSATETKDLCSGDIGRNVQSLHKAVGIMPGLVTRYSAITQSGER